MVKMSKNDKFFLDFSFSKKFACLNFVLNYTNTYIDTFVF